jgi:hypothetical protein
MQRFSKPRMYVVERYLPAENRWEEIPRSRVSTAAKTIKIRDRWIKKGFRCRVRERFV